MRIFVTSLQRIIVNKSSSFPLFIVNANSVIFVQLYDTASGKHIADLRKPRYGGYPVTSLKWHPYEYHILYAATCQGNVYALDTKELTCKTVASGIIIYLSHDNCAWYSDLPSKLCVILYMAYILFEFVVRDLSK